MKTAHIIVIGAGIVGVSSAIWLRRAGFDVTLIDKGQPGMGASYGNGGILARCSIAPVTAPGLIKNAPFYLLDKNFPLFLRWSYLPRLAPWLIKYLSHANAKDTKRIAKGLNLLVNDSVDQHSLLAKGTRAEQFLETSEYNFAYPDRAAFEKDAFTWALRKEAGFDPELIEGDAVQEHEPILGPRTRLLAVNKEHGYISDPAKYVQALVQVLEDLGGRFVQAEVKDYEMTDDKVSAILTTQGRFTCDKALVTAGVWSKTHAGKFGINVPMEAERGYHIVYKNPTRTPRSPMMVAEGKFVVTPMAAGVRCAGVVEFGGMTEKRSKAPLDLLRSSVKKLLPELEATEEEEWMGFRPAPSDSLPLIGELGNSGVYTAFGHHHIGLTSGPQTGRLVSNMIAGLQQNVDMSPYDPMRFAAKNS